MVIRERLVSKTGERTMRVGLATWSNFPVGRQIRTKKIAKAVDEGGGDAVIFARNTSDDPARGTVGDGVSQREERLSYAVVRRFSWLSSTALFGAVTAPIPVNPFWIVWLLLEFSRYDIDVAVACDLRSGIPTVVAATAFGIPVVFDLRENYTGLAHELPTESMVDRIIQNETLVGTLERTTIRLADAVWVVVEERRTQLVDTGVSPEKLTVVSNTPVIDDWAEQTDGGDLTEPETFEWPGFTLVYVGVLNEFRGLDFVLDSMAETAEDDGIHFAVAGEGPYRDALERRCQQLGIEDRVTFLGWIDSDRVQPFLASGDVGVIPHRITPLTEYTIPNKLFDYMLAELPILTRDITPVTRIVKQENCGRVLPPNGTAAETAVQICELSTLDLSELGRNGREAVERRYNWSTDANHVRASLDELCST